MTIGDLRERLAEYSDDDIVVSESRGDNYTDPSIYDNAYTDDRKPSSYYESREEAIEAGVPKKNVKRQVMVTGHT
jgi:hypothetical protein